MSKKETDNEASVYNEELHRILVDRLIHFEQAMMAIFSILFTAIFFIFEYDKGTIYSWITYSIILSGISLLYLQTLINAISYAILLAEMEHKYNIIHIYEKWLRFEKPFKYTHLALFFTPVIITASIMFLLAYKNNKPEILTAIEVIAIYLIIIFPLGLFPVLKLNKTFKTLFKHDENKART